MIPISIYSFTVFILDVSFNKAVSLEYKYICDKIIYPNNTFYIEPKENIDNIL